MKSKITPPHPPARAVSKSGAAELPPPDPVRLVRLRELQRTLIPLSRSTIWRHVRAKTMPSPIRLSQNAIAWKRSEIERWIEERERV